MIEFGMENYLDRLGNHERENRTLANINNNLLNTGSDVTGSGLNGNV